jgi:glutamate-1-semialdehyde 2,1-aminomutase
VPFTVNRVGSMFTAFFAGDPVTDYASAKKADAQRFARFFRGLLERGVYFPPSQFEAAFVSSAHSDDDVTETVRAAGEVLASLGK